MTEKHTVPNQAPAEETVDYEPMKMLMINVTEKGMQVSLRSLTGSLPFQTERREA